VNRVACTDSLNRAATPFRIRSASSCLTLKPTQDTRPSGEKSKNARKPHPVGIAARMIDYLNCPERAIICTRCQYALQPAGESVSKHLWEKHGTSQDEREGLNVFVRSLRLQDPNTLPLRTSGSTQHPHLRLQAGLACQECDYTTTSDHLIRRHINQTHSQVARADKRHHRGHL
jgi:hypothetical protein